MAEKMATREAYGNALVELAEKYDFVVLDADLAAATKTGVFKKKYPERFFDCGIAEGNMISVAAGIATTGVIPFASSFAMFAAGRAYEQVRNSVGYPHLNVKIAATHAGVTVGEDGATHQCNEDIALMRTIPGMVILNPADALETRAAIEAAILHDGPVYIRLGRAAAPAVNAEGYQFEIGKGYTLADGKDITIVATGYMTHIALEAAKLLEAEGVSARVINMPTIKPLDTAILEKAARETGAIVTVEEHSIVGGLGGAVCEALAESCPVPVTRVGVPDCYGRSASAGEMLTFMNLTAENIAARAKETIARRV